MHAPHTKTWQAGYILQLECIETSRGKRIQAVMDVAVTAVAVAVAVISVYCETLTYFHTLIQQQRQMAYASLLPQLPVLHRSGAQLTTHCQRWLACLTMCWPGLGHQAADHAVQHHPLQA